MVILIKDTEYGTGIESDNARHEVKVLFIKDILIKQKHQIIFPRLTKNHQVISVPQ